MKKLLLAFCTVILTFSSQASHIAGGELTVWTDTINGQYQVVVELSLLRDYTGIPLGASQNIEIQYNGVSGGSVTLYLAPGTGTGNVLPQPSSGTFRVFEHYVYRNAFVPAQSNAEIKLVFVHCCRNYMDNYQGQPNYYIEAALDLSKGHNSEFGLFAPMMAYANVGDSVSYSQFMLDMDGDSLHYQLDTPLMFMNNVLSGLPGYFHPTSDSSMPFQLNPVTGILTWLPNISGYYVYRVIVSEYRFDNLSNGYQKIAEHNKDLVFVVSNHASSSFSLAPIPGATNMNNGVPLLSFASGQTGSVQLSFSQIDTSDFDVLVYGGPFEFDAANTSVSKTGVSSTALDFSLDWTPSAQHLRTEPYYFLARVVHMGYNYDLLLAIQVNSSVSIADLSLIDDKVYPNPSANGNLVVQSDLLKNSNCQVSIYSLAGQMVHQGSPGQTYDGRLEFQPNLPAGTYLIRVSDGEKVQHFTWVRE